MPRGKAFPSEVRVKAVGAVVSGESLIVVARRLSIPKSTLIRWVREDGPIQPSNARSREAMAELIYDTIADAFTALRAQLQASADPEWIKDQTAGDLAQLMGTISDRTIRLLAGIRPVNDADSVNGEPPRIPRETGGVDS